MGTTIDQGKSAPSAHKEWKDRPLRPPPPVGLTLRTGGGGDNCKWSSGYRPPWGLSEDGGDERRLAETDKIVVRPERRHCKVATALLDAATAWVRDQPG